MLIQKLRLKRGWSQQQLAEFSGLSVRTVQRLEAGHTANAESLKSLAAVFEIDFAQLSAQPEEPDMNTSKPSSTSHTQTTSGIGADPVSAQQPARQSGADRVMDQVTREEAEALRYVRRIKGLYGHALRYVLVLCLLAGINLLVSPHKWWVVWVAFGWGIGLLMHAIRVHAGSGWFGPEWERRQVERRLGRSL